MSKETRKRTSRNGGSSASGVKKLKQEIDITAECGICKKTLNDPRLMPCVHFFCLACVKTYSEEHSNGNDFKCPVCYRLTTIPTGGVEKFASGEFILKLVDLKHKDRLSGKNRNKCCKPCLGIGRQENAAGYCIQCTEDLCKPCLQTHKVTSGSQYHKTIDSAQPDSMGLLKTAVIFCEDHTNQIIQVYCNDCKIAACSECDTVQHNEHNCTDVGGICHRIRRGVDVDCKLLKQFTVDKKDSIRRVEKAKKRCEKMVNSIERDITRRYESLQYRMQEQYDQLRANLASWKKKRECDLEKMRHDIETEIDAAKRFEKHWTELKKYGSVCDIVEASDSLQITAKKLNKVHAKQEDCCIQEASSEYYKITFKPCLSDLDVGKRVLGKMKEIVGDTIINRDEISLGCFGFIHDESKEEEDFAADIFDSYEYLDSDDMDDDDDDSDDDIVPRRNTKLNRALEFIRRDRSGDNCIDLNQKENEKPTNQEEASPQGAAQSSLSLNVSANSSMGYGSLLPSAASERPQPTVTSFAPFALVKPNPSTNLLASGKPQLVISSFNDGKNQAATTSFASGKPKSAVTSTTSFAGPGVKTQLGTTSSDSGKSQTATTSVALVKPKPSTTSFALIKPKPATTSATSSAGVKPQLGATPFANWKPQPVTIVSANGNPLSSEGAGTSVPAAGTDEPPFVLCYNSMTSSVVLMPNHYAIKNENTEPDNPHTVLTEHNYTYIEKPEQNQ